MLPVDRRFRIRLPNLIRFMTEEEMFSLPCEKCNRPAGKPCGHWEGVPTACVERCDKTREALNKK